MEIAVNSSENNGIGTFSNRKLFGLKYTHDVVPKRVATFPRVSGI